MQVPLNDEREYLGGRVVYATNAGFVRPKRCLGSYTLHDDDVPHGVTALTRGVRYSLFLQQFRHPPHSVVSLGAPAA